MESVDALAASAAAIDTPEGFREWTRSAIRPLLPHAALACGLGHIHAGGVALDYIVTVDYPLTHLDAIRNKAGAIDTPILRRWLAKRTPQLFDAAAPWPEVDPLWLDNFRRNDLRNAAAHACYDAARCVGTYFSFHRLPEPPGDATLAALLRVVPVMHEALVGVVDRLATGNALASRLAALTAREREILGWLREGRSNAAIAAIVGLSETTVKHHVSRIFAKLGAESRADLIGRLAEHAPATPPGRGTKLL